MKKKKKIIGLAVLLSIGGIGAIWLSSIADQAMSEGFLLEKVNFDFVYCIKNFWGSKRQWQWFAIIEIIWIIFLWISLFNYRGVSEAEVMWVTDKIKIPKPVGKGQHGTSRFMTQEEKEKAFYTVKYNAKKQKGHSFMQDAPNLGVVAGMTKKGSTERISCMKEDIHTIVIGSTRSGKSRNIILESIWLRGFIKKSMVITDPKGELYLYTHEYLEERGICTIAFDMRQPKKSSRYNYMVNINRAIDEGDIPAAIDYTWDLVSVLVGVPKGEPLWTNGESAVIAASVLAVGLEAPKEYRNLANVYYFIAYMCKANEYGEMPITGYFNKLPDNHPAKGIFAVAEISPERTRGSFFGSALATLRQFTNWNIADITSQSDFDIQDIGRKPAALFIIIPDEKTTMYSLVSLFINQAYVGLVELANKSGGRVPCDIDFFCDEFGNFPAIPSFGSMLSVGAGRGLRFTLVLQDYQQLEKHYKEDHENIKGNCQNTIYLRTPTPKTLEEISKRTGTYTCQVNSSNGSVSGTGLSGNVSYSGGTNMQSRALLTPDEVGRIERPYSLVLKSGDYPAIFCAPDICMYSANKDFGMGTPEENKKLLMERDENRKENEITRIKLWGIWESERQAAAEEEGERVSFLD